MAITNLAFACPIYNIIDLIENFNNLKLIVNVVDSILEILGILIFLEIIELKFWGLNYNLKKNIMKRSELELDSLNKINNDDINDDVNITELKDINDDNNS